MVTIRPRCAGQGLVEFAEDPEDRCDYAIKFFLDREAFLTEAALYATCFPAFRSTAYPAGRPGPHPGGGAAEVASMADVVVRFLPQVEAVCDTSTDGLVDPQGRPLPPCIVMEKGESLQDWSVRAEPDLFTVLAVRPQPLICHPSAAPASAPPPLSVRVFPVHAFMCFLNVCVGLAFVVAAQLQAQAGRGGVSHLCARAVTRAWREHACKQTLRRKLMQWLCQHQ